MRYRDIIAPDLTFKEHMRGHHSGQSDMTLVAIRDGAAVGRIDYSVFNDEPQVQMIEVSPLHRRQGIGASLLRALQRQFPDREIDLGMLTDDGAALVNAMDQETRVDLEIKADADRLDAVRQELANLAAMADRLYAGTLSAADARVLQARMGEWNDLHDEERELEDRLRDRTPYRRIFR